MALEELQFPPRNEDELDVIKQPEADVQTDQAELIRQPYSEAAMFPQSRLTGFLSRMLNG